MEDLTLAGHRVLKTQIDLNLMEAIYGDLLQEFGQIDPINLRSGSTKTQGPGYQWPKTYTEIQSNLIPKIAETYSVEAESYQITDSWVLLQTNESWIDNPVHDHRGSGSLVVVVYIMADPSKDSISFFDDAGNETVHPVQAGDVLIFPAVVPHKPNPTTATEYKRISYNFTLTRQEPETPESRSRMDICNACDQLMKPVKICKECYCFMPAKTLIPISECPLGKWGKIEARNIFGTGSN
jgi:uncharacterized RmlC-like cupin family protein